MLNVLSVLGSVDTQIPSSDSKDSGGATPMVPDLPPNPENYRGLELGSAILDSK